MQSMLIFSYTFEMPHSVSDTLLFLYFREIYKGFTTISGKKDIDDVRQMTPEKQYTLS